MCALIGLISAAPFMTGFLQKRAWPRPGLPLGRHVFGSVSLARDRPVSSSRRKEFTRNAKRSAANFSFASIRTPARRSGKTRYDWAWQPRGAYPGPYATPTWYRGKVYYTSPTGIVGCMDAMTGAQVWTRNVKEQFQGKGYGFGYAITPLVESDLVILPVGGPDASVVALSAADGQTVWATGSDPASYCPAMPITFQGKRYIVGYLQNALVLLELASGKLLHRQPLSAGYDEHAAWPIYREPHLLLTSPFRVSAESYEIEQGSRDSLLCRPRWTSRELCNDIVSSVLYESHVYGFDLRQLQASKHRPSRGVFRCLDWSSGKVNWSSDEVGQAAVLAADGKLLLLNDTGSLILARADPAGYHELGRVQLFEDDTCWTPPALWQGRLFVRSPSHAVCLYVGRPENLPAGASTTTFSLCVLRGASAGPGC